MTLSQRLEYASVSELLINEKQRLALESVRSKMDSGQYELEEVLCFCGCDKGRVIALRDRYGLPVRTLLCSHCGIMRSSPRLTADSNAAFYQNEYRSLYSGSVGQDALFRHDRERGRQISDQLPSLMGQVDTVYDIGCGTGGILSAVQQKGKTVTGCDFDDDYIAVGRRHGVEIIRGGVQELLEVKNAPADLVILSHVMEHFLDLRAELEEVVKAVRPGGFLLVMVPGIRSIPVAYNGNLIRYLQNAHTYHFSAATLTFVLESMGLNVIIADDSVTAACIRPLDWAPGAPMALAPREEAEAVWTYLQELEANYMAKGDQK